MYLQNAVLFNEKSFLLKVSVTDDWQVWMRECGACVDEILCDQVSTRPGGDGRHTIQSTTIFLHEMGVLSISLFVANSFCCLLLTLSLSIHTTPASHTLPDFQAGNLSRLSQAKVKLSVGA
jgi:hypothetical protein